MTSSSSRLTAVMIFHPVPDAAGFDAWLAELRASAQAADGVIATRVSLREPGFDWALAVTSTSEELLHRWLDGAGRRSVREEGRRHGFLCSTVDLVLIEGGSAPAGISAFRHSIATASGCRSFGSGPPRCWRRGCARQSGNGRYLACGPASQRASRRSRRPRRSRPRCGCRTVGP